MGEILRVSEGACSVGGSILSRVLPGSIRFSVCLFWKRSPTRDGTKTIRRLLPLTVLTCFLMSFPGYAQVSRRPAQTRNLTAAEILDREAAAIVAIYNIDANGQVRSMGSGFVVKADGLVITNFHVIEGASDAVMKLKTSEEFDRAMVVDFDRKRDLVLLKYRAADLPTVTLGNSDLVRQGETAIAIGNPRGLEHTVSDGLISAVRMESGTQMFQISVPISPGSSGGPLYNTRGEVIGITTAELAGERVQNINFAVPLKYALLLLQGPPRMPLTEMGKFTQQFGPPPAPHQGEQPSSASVGNTYTDPSNIATISVEPGWTAAAGGESALMRVSNETSGVLVIHVPDTTSVSQTFEAGRKLAKSVFKDIKPLINLDDSVQNGQPFMWQIFTAKLKKESRVVLIGSTVTANGGLLFYGIMPTGAADQDIKAVGKMFYSLK